METKLMQVYYDSSAYPFKDQARETRYPVIGTSFTGASNTTRIRFYVNQFANIGTCTFIAITKLPSGKKLYEQLSKDTTSDTEPFVYLDISSAYTQEKGDIQIALNVYEGGVNIVVDSESGLYTISGSPIITATGNIKISVAYTPYMDTNYGSVPTISVQQALALVSGKLDETSGIIVIDSTSGVSASVFANGQMVYDKSTDIFYQVVSGEYVKQQLVDIAYEYAQSGSDVILTIKLSDGLGVYKILTINLTTYLASLTYVNAHINDKNNPHEVTKAQVGLGNVVNTGDSDTPLQNGTTKFTTGGAYNLQQAFNSAITEINTNLKTYGKSLAIDETDFKLRLLDGNGNTLSTIDLPLEELIVDGTFDSETQTIILTLFNGNTIEIPVADLVSGLVSTDDLASVLANYYTSTQVDTLLGAKANSSDVYTKTETDDLLDKKANVDGNYPTLTVGLADNLTPYGEDSGAEQENPFISNGTGTNNNTEIVTVGDYGLFKEKQGNTLVVNQKIVVNEDFLSTGGSVSTTSGVGTFTANASNQQVYKTVSTIAYHYYLGIISYKTTIATSDVKARMFSADVSGQATTNWQTSYGIGQFNNNTTISIGVIDRRTENWDAIQVKNAYVVDLTQMFGSNDLIPQDLLDNPSHFSWYYNGDLSYNTGTLVNANGVKLVSTGRNIYNPSETYNVVVPNKTFNYYGSSTTTITYYDKDKNAISTESVASGSQFTTPSNCVYINSSVTSNITITPYYTPEQGGEGYDKYYPYETPYVVDTGTEVLRKAGSVCDYKEPNGTIHRLVGSYTFTGSESWTLYADGNFWYHSSSSIIPQNGDNRVVCSNGVIIRIANNSVLRVYISENPQITGSTNMSQLFQSGTVINYELATPTTEQGTPFAENLPINDYGMLYWLDSNDELVGIPQGVKIFYPTNYKGFVDDMYSRVDGDSSDYVVKSELSASETQRDTIDTQLKNAIGGTLRQLLAINQSIDFNNTNVVDLGTLTWGASGGGLFHSEGLNGLAKKVDNGKLLCTKYVKSANGYAIQNNEIAFLVAYFAADTLSLEIKDTAYSSADATEFKNAMKGVLLAYEKAEE